MSHETLCPGCFEEKGQVPICPHCDYDENRTRSSIFLRLRSTLAGGKYIIGRDLGSGGFGMTYLAYETRLKVPVAVKEYLPRDLVGRDAGGTSIETHGREEKELFHQGIEDFLEEARRVASLDHVCIVKVRDFFQDNGTAYMVMDYYPGCTLSQHVRRNGPVSEATALGLMMPILDGLRTEVHRKDLFHRDISPQNIMVQGGPPILIDFGAARRAMRERSRSLTVQYKPGFAPIEQYQRRGRLDSRADIYACAAVLYWMVTGTVPPASIDRIGGDELEPPDRLAAGLSDRFCHAILAGLAIDARDRPQTVEDLQKLLREGEKAEATETEEKEEETETHGPVVKRRFLLAAVPAAAALILAVAGWFSVRSPDPGSGSGTPATPPGLYLTGPVDEGQEISATLFRDVRGKTEDGEPGSFEDLRSRKSLCLYRSLAASERLRWEDVGFCHRLDQP